MLEGEGFIRMDLSLSSNSWRLTYLDQFLTGRHLFRLRKDAAVLFSVLMCIPVLGLRLASRMPHFFPIRPELFPRTKIAVTTLPPQAHAIVV